jgi:NAD+ diphosphatase
MSEADLDLAEVTAPPLARSTLDRAAHHRDDAAWLATAWPGARLLLVDPAKGASLVRESAGGCALALQPTTGDGPGEAMFLGVEPDGVAVFADVGPLPRVEGTSPGNLRDMGHLLDDRDAGLFTTALALANWHAGHPFSSITGLPTTVRDAGWSRVDEAGKQMWPRTDPAMIVLVHDGVAGPDGRCLLGNNAAWPRVPGVQRFSCLAGYVEPGESAEAAVAREVAEEVGIALDRIDYIGSQSWPFPGSLMLGFHALADPTQPVRVDQTEITQARWFSRAEMRAIVGGAAIDVGEGRRASLPMRVSIAFYLISRWLGSSPPTGS